VTFRNFARADQVERVPLDRLLVETDSPYLAPVPHRGHRNEPAHVVETLRRVAELRGGDAEELGHAVTRNARRFYGLDDSGGAGREADARGLRMASDPSPADVRGGESA
jgi:TatD DNase family protein